MATLISAYQISKAFASKTLFQKISFSIETQQKIGLIGPNGAGKSTLLKILNKSQTADDGQISYANNLRLAYLDQRPQFDLNKSIYETLIEVCDDHYDSQNIAYAFELIKKLSLDQSVNQEHTLIKQLSGGWQKRVAIARELMKRPNLFLMDEPTNHLDIQSILWLENFIQQQNMISFMIITHDRAFLQNTCQIIFDLDPQNPDGLIKSFGDYAQFLETKSMLLDGQKRLEEKRRNTMLIEKEWLARGPQARLAKQKARQNRAHDLIAEVDQLESKNTVRKSDFDFATTGNSPKKLIELKDISKHYNQHILLSHLSGLIRPQSRIGLLGANGCGKSTLIRILMGKEQPSTGEIFINPDIQINYFEQGKESLNPKQTVLRVICPEGDYVHFQGKPVYAKSYLSRFHFNNFQMEMPVEKLSGGEQSRLLLAKLMLTTAHVLILDEPTNDLDVETLDVLSECLEDYNGAVILVSHDRFFLDQNTNEIWAFTQDDQGQIIKFADYYQWESWFKTEGEKIYKSQQQKDLAYEAANLQATENIQSTNTKPKSTSNKKLSYKETLEFEKIESVIAEKENLLTSLQNELNRPEVQSQYSKLTEITHQIESLQQEITQLYDRWSYLESKQNS